MVIVILLEFGNETLEVAIIIVGFLWKDWLLGKFRETVGWCRERKKKKIDLSNYLLDGSKENCMLKWIYISDLAQMEYQALSG